MRRAADLLRAGALVALTTIVAVAVVATGGRSASSADSPAPAASGWQGLLGVRPQPQLGDREIVVLRLASLADRLRAAGGVATEAQEKAWTRDAERAQRRVLQGFTVYGVPIEPEQTFVRVFNGFSAALDAAAVAALERDGLVKVEAGIVALP